MDITNLVTIRDMIRWATTCFNEAKLFYGHGTDNAADDAFALVFGALKLSPEAPSWYYDARLTPRELANIAELIERRVTERVPTPYLTHEAWFGGLRFYVNEHVLIPRSPIAELIEQHFKPWLATDNVDYILDLCTGSGCIAVLCAQAFPDSLVDASDISSDALAVASKNVACHHLTDQITLHQSNLFENLPSRQYDIIVSNPPYVDAEDMASLPAEYRHEPTLALAAGPDGLALVTNILLKARRYLSPNGILVVEVGNSEAALLAAFPELPFTWLEFSRGGGGVFVLNACDLPS